MAEVELVSAGELKAMIGVIVNDVLAADDLDPTSKKILIAALEHMYPWLEVHRRRRATN
jgi:hypothetical protein